MPNTRILLHTNTLTISGDTAGRKTIICDKGAVYDNKHFKQEDGVTGAALAATNPNEIRTCDDVGGTHQEKALNTVQIVEINLPTKLAEQLFRYLNFKKAIKTAKTHGFAVDHVDLRNLIYDSTDAAATVTGSLAPKERFIWKGTNTIVLNENYFVGGLAKLDDIKSHFWLANVDDDRGLDHANYASVDSPNVTDNATVKNAFAEELQAFEATEKLISGLETDINNWKGGTALPDVTGAGGLQERIDKLEVFLGGLEGRDYKPNDNTDLPNFPGGSKSPQTILAARNATPADVINLAKRALFDLDIRENLTNAPAGAEANKYYKHKIFGTAYTTHNDYGWGGLYQTLCELKVWKECGFNTIEEIVRANTNGYFITNRGSDEASVFGSPPNLKMMADGTKGGKIYSKKLDGSSDVTDADANIDFIKNIFGTGKKFMRFDMINVGETKAAAANDRDNRYRELAGLRFNQAADQKITERNVNAFRTRMNEMGLNADGTLAAAGSDIGLEDKNDITDRKDCMGFQPGEGAHSNVGTDGLLTKICLDIVDAPDRKTAIALAFYGKDYTVAVRNGKIETPDSSLELNECSAKNFFTLKTKADGSGLETVANTNKKDTSPDREKHLKNYYEVMKMHMKCAWLGIDGATGAATDVGKEKYDVLAGQTEIDNAYNAALVWAKIWDKWTASTKPNKATAIADKVIVERYLKKSGTPTAEEKLVATSNPNWKTAMENAITAMDGVITGQQTPKMSQEAKDELAKYRDETGNSEEVKKFYQAVLDNNKDDKDVSKTVVEKIKVIVEAVKKIQVASPSETDIKSLEDLLKKTDADEKKAAEVAKAVKADSKAWVEEAITQARGKLLQKAKDAAKEAMKNEGGDSADGAYAQIGVESETSTEVINKITELFKKAKAAWEIAAYKSTLDQPGGEIKGLEAHEGKDEWNKVNKYTKKNDKPYASGALEWIKSLKKKNDVALGDIANSATGNEAIDKYENGDPVAGVKKEDAHRLAMWIELKNGSEPAEKDLAKYLQPQKEVEFFSDLDDKLDKSLEDITTFIEGLKKYKDANEDTPEGKAIKKVVEKITKVSDADAKKALEDWLTRLETHKQQLETKKQERDKNEDGGKNNKDGINWTGSTMITVYCVLAVAVIGGIAWLALKGSGESEEVED